MIEKTVVPKISRGKNAYSKYMNAGKEGDIYQW